MRTNEKRWDSERDIKFERELTKTKWKRENIVSENGTGITQRGDGEVDENF